MSVEDSFVAGTVYYFGGMEDLAQIFVEAGFVVRIGQWALRIDQLGAPSSSDTSATSALIHHSTLKAMDTISL